MVEEADGEEPEARRSKIEIEGDNGEVRAT